MFSKKNNIFGTVVFRLTLWYSFLLVVLSSIVFILIYIRLTSNLNHRMDSVLIADVIEFEELYNKQGIEAIKSEFQREAESGGIKKVFFRLFSPDLKVLANSDMDQWQDMKHKLIELKNLSDSSELLQTIKLPEREHRVRVIYKKIADGNIFEIGNSLKNNEELMERYRETFGWGIGAILVLGTIVGWTLASQAMSGVRRVTRTAVRIGRGDLTQRVLIGNEGSEIDNLAMAFNKMLEHIQLLVTELKEVTNNIAHDLRSPVTCIRGVAETTLNGQQNLETYQQMSSTVIEECDKLVVMINTMLDIAETQSGVADFATTNVDIVKIVKDACELFQPVAEDKGIILKIDVQNKHLFVLGDISRLQRVLANLLDNAINYTDSGGKVVISVELLQKQVKISVADSGIGISDKDLSHIFERFYRVDKSRSSHGNGLGLSLAQAIVYAHKGQLYAKSSLGKGSIFTIILPQISDII